MITGEFSSAYLGLGCWGSSLSKDIYASLFLDSFFSSFPGLHSYNSDSSKSGSSTGPPPGGAFPEKPPKRGIQVATETDAEQPQLAPFDVEWQQLYSELLPGDTAPHPVSMLAGGNSFRQPVSEILFFWSWPIVHSQPRWYKDCTDLRRGPTHLPGNAWANAFSMSTKHMLTGWGNSHKPLSSLWRV